MAILLVLMLMSERGQSAPQSPSYSQATVRTVQDRGSGFNNGRLLGGQRRFGERLRTRFRN